MAQIEVHNMTKTYKMGDTTVYALRDVSLSIDEGEYVAIMGPSGSGKSTLMHILGLLDIPSSGSYRLNGVETSKLSEDQLAILRRRSVGFIFQQFNLLTKMNASENVALPLLYSMGKVTMDKAQDLLRRVGLGDRLFNRPNQMSGGQQQRVAIARSLVNGPRIIFADEPTGNLDSASEKEIIQVLEDLNKQGITIVIVTHEEEIGQHARRIIRFRDGHVLSDERKDEKPEIKNIVPPDLRTLKPEPLRLTDVREHMREGLRSLAANKVRTLLSMLGILIGVAAVIAMLALGAGAQNAIEQQLSSLGSNLLVVRPGTVRVGGVFQASGSVTRLSLDDGEALKAEIAGIKEVSPSVQRTAQVTFQNKNWSTQILGASPAYARIHSAEPEVGRFFSNDENQRRMMLAVLGMTVVRELFGDKNPIGEYIKINRINFQVVGILPPKGATGWRDNDDIIVIPVVSAMRRLLGKDYVDFIEVEAEHPEEMDSIQDSISTLLTTRHRIPPSQKDNAFDIRNMSDIKDALTSSSKTMSILLATIAAISLVVGGIGIMNIMLVSVTERTREIGLRKAIGARKTDILLQFLVEAVVISSCGGIIGIFLGWFATLILSAAAGWTTSVSFVSVFVSFLFSVSIGIIFGIYPARRASELHPIQALRYD